MRSFFLRRTWRERALLLLLLAVIVVLAFGRAADRWSELRVRWGAATAENAMLRQWLAQAADVEARVASGLQAARGSQALTAGQFQARLDALLRQQRFDFRLDTPATERRPPVAVHTVTVALDKASLPGLVAFATELGSSLPLVNIEQITIGADRRNPAQLDVRIRLAALEILP